jgi:hypothetical protein
MCIFLLLIKFVFSYYFIIKHLFIYLLLKIKICDAGQTWWYIPVIPATGKVEVGGF